MPSGKVISPERKEAIAKMGRSGYSASRIAEAFGLRSETILTILHKKGVEIRSGRTSDYTHGD